MIYVSDISETKELRGCFSMVGMTCVPVFVTLRLLGYRL